MSTPMMRRQTTRSGHAELVEAVSGMGTRTSKKPPPVTMAWETVPALALALP